MTDEISWDNRLESQYGEGAVHEPVESAIVDGVLVTTGYACPNCSGDHDVMCPECGSHWMSCTCPDKDYLNQSEELFCIVCQTRFWHLTSDTPQTIEPTEAEDFDEESETWMAANIKVEPTCTCKKKKKFFCGKCRVARSNPAGKWKALDKVSEPKKSSSSTTYVYEKCRHYHVPVDLGNGVIMHPSSMNNERNKGGETQPVPDFGLYADYGWRPTWRNELINWPDYGIPHAHKTACDQIRDAYYLAKGGSDVEIGCIGGHGRTGTILACMYVYASWDQKEPKPITAEEAVKKVHTDYCTHAVESQTQEWFVSFFSNYFFGTPLAAKPVSKVTTTGGGSGWGSGSLCSITEHLAMVLNGHTECVTKGDKCTWWDKDLVSIAEKKNEYNDKVLERAQAMVKKGMFPKKAKTLPAGKVPVSQVDEDTTYAECEHSQTDHYAMFLHGWEICATDGLQCKWWAEDFENFNNGILDCVSMNVLQDMVDKCKPLQQGLPSFVASSAIPVGSLCDGSIWTGQKWEEYDPKNPKGKQEENKQLTVDEILAENAEKLKEIRGVNPADDVWAAASGDTLPGPKTAEAAKKTAESKTKKTTAKKAPKSAAKNDPDISEGYV